MRPGTPDRALLFPIRFGLFRHQGKACDPAGPFRPSLTDLEIQRLGCDRKRQHLAKECIGDPHHSLPARYTTHLLKRTDAGWRGVVRNRLPPDSAVAKPALLISRMTT